MLKGGNARCLCEHENVVPAHIRLCCETTVKPILPVDNINYHPTYLNPHHPYLTYENLISQILPGGRGKALATRAEGRGFDPGAMRIFSHAKTLLSLMMAVF
jgi:hypothetical protein